MTEIGTDSLVISPEDYVSYHTEQLELLKKHNIGWMYNCVQNVLSVPNVLYYNQGGSYTVTPIEGSPYFENREITDMLASFN